MGHVTRIEDYLRRKEWEYRNDYHDVHDKAQGMANKGLRLFAEALAKKEGPLLDGITKMQEKQRQYRIAAHRSAGIPIPTVSEALKTPPKLKSLTIELPPGHIDITG